MTMISGRRMDSIISTKLAIGMTSDLMVIRASIRDKEDPTIMEVKDLASSSPSTRMRAPNGRKVRVLTIKLSTHRTIETTTIREGTIRTRTTSIIEEEDHRIALHTLATMKDLSGRIIEVLSIVSKIGSKT